MRFTGSLCKSFQADAHLQPVIFRVCLCPGGSPASFLLVDSVFSLGVKGRRVRTLERALTGLLAWCLWHQLGHSLACDLEENNFTSFKPQLTKEGYDSVYLTGLFRRVKEIMHLKKYKEVSWNCQLCSCNLEYFLVRVIGDSVKVFKGNFSYTICCSFIYYSICQISEYFL